MRVLVGLSGGVDSSYAALKLMRRGVEVEGATLKMHSYTEIEEARAAAESLGIPLHVIDCTEEFEDCVVENFIKEYKNARTPNPCIVCNSEIKFPYMLKYALDNGFDAIATGHYATLHEIDGKNAGRLGFADASALMEKRYALGFGADAKKDQTYMLWRLPQSVLSRLILPLCDESKENVKKMAEHAGLTAAHRAESQEICFVPDNDYAAFIEARTEPSEEGSFVDEQGNILGKHRGIIRYTTGQRRGLGISASGRIFVKKIDPVSNNIILSLEDTRYTKVYVSAIRYQAAPPCAPGEIIEAEVKLRYAAPPVPARVRFISDAEAEVILESPVRAVTPGQSAVFYRDGILLFGGFIDGAE